MPLALPMHRHLLRTHLLTMSCLRPARSMMLAAMMVPMTLVAPTAADASVSDVTPACRRQPSKKPGVIRMTSNKARRDAAPE